MTHGETHGETHGKKKEVTCGTCKYSAVCLAAVCVPNGSTFPLYFIHCMDCDRYFRRAIRKDGPERFAGNETLMDGAPDVCAEVFSRIPQAIQCAYCASVLPEGYLPDITSGVLIGSEERGQ